MTSKKVDFSAGNIRGNILSMAFPMLIAQVFSILYNIVDRIYIGNLPSEGEMALSGIGVCLPIVTIITGFANLFGLGGAPLFSIARGKKDNENADEIIHNAFWMLIITGLLLTTAGLIFLKPLLYLFGASSETYVYASGYMRIYILGTCFSMVSLGMNPYINNQGYAKIGMLTVVIGAVANFILDPVFIFGFSMGVKGAAVATVISQGISALWVLRFLTGTKAEFPLKLKNIRINLKCIRSITALGTASFIMSITDSLVQIVCNKMLLKYGGDIYIGIMAVIQSVRQVVITPVSAITDGSSSVISYNYGAEKTGNVKKSIRFMTMLSFSYSVFVCLFILLFPDLLIKLFSNNTALLSEGSGALRIYFLLFFMMAFQYSGQSVFKSLNMAKLAIFFSLLRKVIIVIPLTIILPAFMGTDGVFLAESVSNVMGGSVCFLTMLFVAGRKLDKKRNRGEIYDARRAGEAG
ncbi:MAG: MATE family efflux transporter [Lachnospiraceae bacterium]